MKPARDPIEVNMEELAALLERSGKGLWGKRITRS